MTLHQHKEKTRQSSLAGESDTVKHHVTSDRTSALYLAGDCRRVKSSGKDEGACRGPIGGGWGKVRPPAGANAGGLLVEMASKGDEAPANWTIWNHREITQVNAA